MKVLGLLKGENVNEVLELGKEFSGYFKYSWFLQGVVKQEWNVVDVI